MTKETIDEREDAVAKGRDGIDLLDALVKSDMTNQQVSFLLKNEIMKD